MTSRFGASLSGNVRRTGTTMRHRSGLPSMSEKQSQAYLIARDALRRIARTSSLVFPPPDEGSGAGVSDATRRADRCNS